MSKLSFVGLISLFILGNNTANAFDYTVLRDQTKPANPKILSGTAKSMEDTGFVSVETDGFGTMPIDWVDQIWSSPDMAQAIILKYDLKPKDESLIGKVIKMKSALLIHGHQESGAYFAAYFSGFDEKSALVYFNKIQQTKGKTAFKIINETFSLPSAYAEQTNSCDGKKAGLFKGLFSVVKEYKWTCLKSFVKVAFGSIIGKIATTALGILDGSIWNNVGKNWEYIVKVVQMLSNATKSLKDLDYLPFKERTEYICESLGKAANTAASSFASGITSSAATTAANQIINQVLTHKMDAKYKKIIEQNKIKNLSYAVCAKPSTKNKKDAVPGATLSSGGHVTDESANSGKSSRLGK